MPILKDGTQTHRNHQACEYVLFPKSQARIFRQTLLTLLRTTCLVPRV